MEDDFQDYVSFEQLFVELVILLFFFNFRWQNLFNLDVIKVRIILFVKYCSYSTVISYSFIS